ncbi:hypothetical protein DY000_02036185 [Brassica cretica]|uniref:Uncharacterized protein n=1 Tax=Brassica cretica TaxID=69181 RepID=A0ABQ7BB38_BRACR|nr:hypothetical protein DY000_02036185 [Brassica cretica]
MASVCRSFLMSGSVSRSRTVTQKCLNLKPTTTTTSSHFASVSQSIPRASRVLSALGSVETMIPLHSAVASARLRSSIAADSSCWSWLSLGKFSFLFFFFYLAGSSAVTPSLALVLILKLQWVDT